jgi:O-methyltransferase involved in polyketide biosynthesis
MEPIHKFNNGRGAMLCNICRTIISTGPATKELYCEKCKPKQESLVERMIPLQLKYNLDMMKQETLEEVAENYVDSFEYGIAHPRKVAIKSFINGAKWQQERSYSEEDLKDAFFEGWIARDGKLTFSKAKNKWFKELKTNKI